MFDVCVRFVLYIVGGVATGRLLVQGAVSRWLPTTAGRVRARVCSSGFRGGESGAGAGFLRVLRFSPPIFIPPNSPSSQSLGASTRGQSGRHAEWPNLDSTSHYANLKTKKKSTV
jgi:hypothetical protein